MKSIKGEINLIALLMFVCTGLGSVSLWFLKSDYEVGKQAVKDFAEYRDKNNSRLVTIEVQQAERAQQIKEQLVAIKEELGETKSSMKKIWEKLNK